MSTLCPLFDDSSICSDFRLQKINEIKLYLQKEIEDQRFVKMEEMY